jgi:hypothetical protein
MAELVFSNSKTIGQFKADNNVSKIDIVKNPKTEKIFFSYVGGSGAVSSKWVRSEVSIISTVSDRETGETFLMLHNEGVSNVIDTL